MTGNAHSQVVENGQAARVPEPDHGDRLPATATALVVMTDFYKVQALTVSPDRHIDDALRDMIVGGTRSLLVTHEGRLVGLVTAADILGERPIQFLQDPTCDGNPCRHSDIHVHDIMTRREALKTLALDEVRSLTVGELATLFKNESITHMLVMQPDCGGDAEVRGILSRSRLARDCAIDL